MKNTRPHLTPRFVIDVYASPTHPEATLIVYAKNRAAALRVFASAGRDIRSIELSGHYDRSTNLVVEPAPDADPKSGVREIISSQSLPNVKSGPA